MTDKPGENNETLLNRICDQYFAAETVKEQYLPVSFQDLSDLAPGLPGRGVGLIDLFCVENFAGRAGFTLFYVLEKRGSSAPLILQLALPGATAFSVARDLPSAAWFERKVRDGFGVDFEGAFDRRRLFLHEPYPSDFHPLRKSFTNQSLGQDGTRRLPAENYSFKKVEGNGVYQVLVGPVHAGIIEPGHFHFSVIGETVLNLELRLFYKHRGIEKLAEGKTPLAGVELAEAISGDESVANATAFCLAVERICGLRIPQKAWHLRTIMLEMERIHSHLGSLAGMIVDVAFPAGASPLTILREEIFQFNEILTGSRFLKGMVCPGGLKKEISMQNLFALTQYLSVFSQRFNKAVEYLHGRDTVIDRLETTGVIRPELVQPLNLSGPAARAAGVAIDTRLDHPYGIYSALDLKRCLAEGGDVLGRFDVKAAEVSESVRIIQKLIEDSSDILGSAVNREVALRDGYALSLVEAPRGQTLHWLYLRNGLIERYEVRTASFCNWQAIEHAIMGNIIPDFPLINKSLDLSYAGTDL